jgi:ureidoacrylate peracid hydrolase
VCCESTARDAMMLNYKVFFVSDANAARTDAEHNATLANMMLWFADVRSADAVVELIRAADAA